jgi:ectoine hydroxylase-related dioxygenase (phytanoyl-CoA dioxygenase family)
MLRSQYEREGYVVVRGVLDPELIQEASEHVTWLVQKNPGTRPEQLHTHLMADDPFWVRLVSDDRLLDIAEKFVGPDIALFASHYISKPPFDGQPVLWHQDGSYWPLDPMQVVTLWLAVDDSTSENGCMRVMPGTHTLGLQPLQRRSDVASVLGSGIDESLLDESKAVDVILKPGDVSIHHPNLIHGSNANNSPTRRCGLTIRYIPTSTRIVSDKPWPSAFLLRGQAAPGINDYRPWPMYVPGKHMPFRNWEQWNQRCQKQQQSTTPAGASQV